MLFRNANTAVGTSILVLLLMYLSAPPAAREALRSGAEQEEIRCILRIDAWTCGEVRVWKEEFLECMGGMPAWNASCTFGRETLSAPRCHPTVCHVLVGGRNYVLSLAFRYAGWICLLLLVFVAWPSARRVNAA